MRTKVQMGLARAAACSGIEKSLLGSVPNQLERCSGVKFTYIPDAEAALQCDGARVGTKEAEFQKSAERNGEDVKCSFRHVPRENERETRNGSNKRSRKTTPR